MFHLDLLFDPSDAQVHPVADVDAGFMHHHCQSALSNQTRMTIVAGATVQMSVSWCDECAMQALNERYRERSAPTNVLSFTSGLPPLTESANDPLLVLGDLVLCPAVIEREACEQNKPLQHHWAHMLVHGTLHLCGYDHEQCDQARSMEVIETRILAQAGINNPYEISA